jgi:hypothetical protein
MPRRMRDERRQNDHPDTLGDDALKENGQQRNRERQDSDLSDLDANVEREERRDEVSAGELERFAKRERKTESMDEPETERDDPPAVEPLVSVRPIVILRRPVILRRRSLP